MTSGSGDPLVSVIVPIYNTKPYLDEALASIRGQALADMEIIAIDDASTDGSAEVLDTHATADPRIRVLSLASNLGLAAVRNLGLTHARGKYVYFFDSDDLLEPDALLRLVHRAERDRLDLVLFNARPLLDGSVDSDEGLLSLYERQYLRTHEYSAVRSGQQLVVLMSDHGEWKPSACLYLTRRELIARNRLQFTEGALHEDNGFTMRLMLSAERAGYDPRAYFVRRVRAGSITTRGLSAAHVRGLITATTEIVRAPLEVLAPRELDASLSTSVVRQAEPLFHDALAKYLRLSRDEQRGVDEWTPSDTGQIFCRNRLTEAARAAREKVQLEEVNDQLARLSAEVEGFRRSRAVRLSRKIRSAFAFLRR